MMRTAWVLIAVLGWGASAFADDAAESCRKAPTRACVLEAAAAAADKVGKPFLKANLLALVARDQHYYGLPDASAATLARAVEAAKSIPADNDMGTSVPAITAVRAEMGDLPAALELARGIENPVARVYALAGVGIAQQRQGKADDAKATFALAIQTADATPADRRAFLIAQVANGEARVGLPEAVATFDRAFAATNAKVSAAPASYVIGQRIKAGDYARAFIEISDLDETWRNILLTSLVTAAANSGDIDTATAVQPSISGASDAARVMATLAVANFRSGHAMPAAQWIVKAQAAADRETVAAVKAEEEADIAGAEVVAGMAARAKAHLDEASIALDAPATDKIFRPGIARAWARAAARGGDTKTAVDLLRSHVEGPGVTTDFIDIAADLGAARQWGAAFEVLQAIPFDDQRAGALIEFAAKLPS